MLTEQKGWGGHDSDYVLEVPYSNLGWDTEHPEAFRDFPESHHAKNRAVPAADSSQFIVH
jgi:hypothetical protein